MFPEPVLWLRPILQPGFAATMFFVGTLVRPEQVRVFRRNPARTLLGLLVQYTVMPLTAWAISFAFDDPMVRVGVILVGCMPGAMASNVMTLLFRGDLILSVTMTTVATLTCPLILAFWLPLLADTRLQVPVAEPHRARRNPLPRHGVHPLRSHPGAPVASWSLARSLRCAGSWARAAGFELWLSIPR